MDPHLFSNSIEKSSASNSSYIEKKDLLLAQNLKAIG